MTPPVSAPVLPLSALPRRTRGIVAEHGVDAATSERLSALGLGLGATFTVLKAGSQPTVLVGESRIGLSSGLAGAIGTVSRSR